jgi:hypothetical protein
MNYGGLNMNYGGLNMNSGGLYKMKYWYGRTTGGYNNKMKCHYGRTTMRCQQGKRRRLYQPTGRHTTRLDARHLVNKAIPSCQEAIPVCQR